MPVLWFRGAQGALWRVWRGQRGAICGALQQFGAGIQEMLFVLADNAVYCRHLESLYAFLDLPNRKYQGTLPVEKRAFCQDGDMDMKSNCATCPSAIPAAKPGRCAASAPGFAQGTRWPSSGRMAAAKPRLSSCSAACTIPTRARSCSTASISANTIMRSTCGCSLWCFRISACWRSRWAKMWPLPGCGRAARARMPGTRGPGRAAGRHAGRTGNAPV